MKKHISKAALLLLIAGCANQQVATEVTTTLATTTTSSTTTTSTTTTSTTTTTTIPPTTMPTPGEQATDTYGRCTQYEALLAEYAPTIGWDVNKMSRIMWRESRCTPNLYSRTSDSGLLQINKVNWDDLSTQFGVAVNREALYDPVLNIKSAAVLCEVWDRHGYSCYQPWGG